MSDTNLFDKISGIGVASGFKLQAKAPLDPRLVVDTIEDRNKLVTENGAYEGMKVYVKADKKEYQLKGTTNADWASSDSGGSIVVDTEITKDSPNPISSGAIYEIFSILEEI